VLVANGVTSVRDLGGRLGELDEWRTKINAGLLTGPRILRAGPILNGQKFNTYQMVSGNAEETRGVVRALKEVGVDFLKTHRRMPRDSYFALIDEAKKQGLTLVGHIPMTVTPEEASDAGQVTIEHTETLFEGTFSAALKGRKLPDAIRQFRAEDADKLFARFVKNRTVVDPTLIAFRSFVDSTDPSAPPDPRSRYVALSLKKEWEKISKPASPEDLAELKATLAELREVVRQMNRAGVTLVAGSDIAGPRIPGFSLHDELVLLVEAGLTPMQALQAATLTPARVLNKATDLGSIETGKIADLILLDGDPLADIRHTQRIRAVVVNGKLLDRAALDRLLAEAERAALEN
jgi:imidazolonepropionase-like amidohydrolase